jgi:hypothetical protein
MLTRQLLYLLSYTGETLREVALSPTSTDNVQPIRGENFYKLGTVFISKTRP